MSLADDKSQIFNTYKIKADVQALSSITLASKRKGLSLSKQLKESKERPQSYIKLSARTKNKNAVEKRQIKLIIKPKGEFFQQLSLNRSNKENIRNKANGKGESIGQTQNGCINTKKGESRQGRQRKYNAKELVSRQFMVKPPNY